MKIGILSFRSRDIEPAVEDLKLVQATKDLGHEPLLILARDCSAVYKEEEEVFWCSAPFPELDLLIPRARFVYYAELQLHFLQILEKKYLTLNKVEPIMHAKNKIKTMQILRSVDLPMPYSMVIDDPSQVPWAVQKIGTFPLIAKAPYGTFGEGVHLIHSQMEVEEIFQAMAGEGLSMPLIVQEFIQESAGRDTRVFVMGGKVLAAMERQAAPGEFRSNVERGATATFVDVDPLTAKLACDAVKALGLDYGGVDIIHSKRGPLILEVNANPGFKKLEEVSGINIARALIEYGLSGDPLQSHQ